ncbi:MAG TPA: SGNH/GDSL hydrolase family protein [Trueperaceae bacterium]
MTTFVRPDDSRLAWPGAISLKRTSEWVAPWRLPVESLQLYPFEELHEQAEKPAGVRVTFRSNARSLICHFQPVPADSPARLDLTARGTLLGSVALAGSDRAEFSELPPGEKLLEVWLPQNQALRLTGFELEEGATLAPRIEERSRRWITYGSSITQCQGADSPARTWPALVARKANLNLTCLGFSGQCHIEPMLARLIRDQPADLISLCLGINVQGGSSLSMRTFRPAVLGFASIVRERHRSAPLALISPIYSPERESTANAAGLTLEIMREEIRAAVEALRGLGDEHVYYVDGLELLGEEEDHLLPDHLHPNQQGYELMAERFLEKVLPRLT